MVELEVGVLAGWGEFRLRVLARSNVEAHFLSFPFVSRRSFSLPPNPTSNASPPLTHARNPSSGAFASHTRMGSIGSGQASWNSTSNPSPPLANATVVPGSGVAARRESQSGGGGGADAALGEVRRALGLVASAGLARTG